jgi:AcrR family transcriptional regulator
MPSRASSAEPRLSSNAAASARFAAGKDRGRRTQAERSEAMRRRLLAATVASLAEDGYAGSTLSSIVRRAGVSRGAQVHHYPSKQALMLDAADDLLRSSYRTLGAVLLAAADEDNRLEMLVKATWEQLFNTPAYRAYSELAVASQRDSVLAEALRGMLLRVIRLFEPAVRHYFEPAPGSHENLHALFLQFSALLGGLAAQAHLFQDPAYVDAQLRLWTRQTQRVMRARKGVKTPPPRPAEWDRAAG